MEIMHRVDGIDVEVDGHVLHLADAKLDEKQVDAAAEAFRAWLKAEAAKPPRAPEPDYRSKYEDLKTAVTSIDLKATRDVLVAALTVAVAVTAEPVVVEPVDESVVEKLPTVEKV